MKSDIIIATGKSTIPVTKFKILDVSDEEPLIVDLDGRLLVAYSLVGCTKTNFVLCVNKRDGVYDTLLRNTFETGSNLFMKLKL